MRDNNIWKVWKMALGSFSDEQTAGHDDVIALIRTFIVTVNIVCAFFIMANIIKGWVT